MDIAHWGQAKGEWLAEFLDLPQGMPSHDRFGRNFAGLDPASLQQAFVRWMNALADLSQDIVALGGKGPIHVVNAWASANELGLAQFKVDAKTSEITALPELLRMRNLAGAVVSIDAMGCQVEIARQIQAQGADHVLSLLVRAAKR